MRSISTPQFIAKRLADDWKLLLAVFAGITVAAILVSGAPVYVKSLGRIGFLASIEQSPPLILNILTASSDVPIDREGLTRVEASVEKAFQDNVSPIYRGHNRLVKTDTVLFVNPAPIVPDPRLALAQGPLSRFEETKDSPFLGRFMNSQGLVTHVNVVRGRMPELTLFTGTPPTNATVVEATLGLQVADALGLDLGDEVLLTESMSTSTAAADEIELVPINPGEPFRRGLLGVVLDGDAGDEVVVSAEPLNPATAVARIVGIIEPIDPGEAYWGDRIGEFFGPSFQEDQPNFQTQNERDRLVAAFIIHPEVASRLPDELVEPSQYRTQRANIATITNLAQHVTILEGRFPNDEVLAGPRGPIIEALVGSPLAEGFKVHVGDVISLTPFLDEPIWVSATIVGIAERTDPDDTYWLWGPSGLFVPVAPESPAQLGVMITPEAMFEGVAKAYPGTLAGFVWYTEVDSTGFDEWTAEETHFRIQDLDAALASALPGQLTSTGIGRLVDGFERRILLGSVPLLLLVATIVVTVLYFVSMMVSYLVRSRERDLALLKTRGISTPRMIRLYGVEGLVVTVIAVAVAPLLALAGIAAAGKLSHFESLTGGDFLPVEIGLAPFLVAFGVGVLCLSIFVVPSVASAKAGLVLLKLRSSRPPAVPFFHRNYLDLAVMVVAGIVFWELHSRGDLVAGGLFEDVEVNETLLLAPVLLMVVVALLFSRFFPLVLKFISGESPVILHAIVAVTVVALVSGIIARDLLNDDSTAWIGSVAPVIAFAAAYVARYRTRRLWWRTWWLVIQVPLIAVFFLVEPLDSSNVLMFPAIALSLAVPGQIAFILLRSYARVSPVWVSLALWRMARNPLQYTWLILLLVLVSGLATFAQTMRTTLDARDEARIQYEIAADARVSISVPVNTRALESDLAAIPGVGQVSPAYRARGSGKLFGGSFDVFSVRSLEFGEISWYRDDFSDARLDDVMQALRPYAPPRPLVIPTGSTKIGVWAKLGESTPGLSIKFVVQDGYGTMRALPQGEVGSDWTLVTSELPADMLAPLRLVAIQVIPRKRLIGAPNSVLLDDIHATIGGEGLVEVLDDFEGVSRWQPMPTSFEESQSAIAATTDSHQGVNAVKYSVSQQNRNAVPGIYQSPSGGPLPVVVSESFAETTEAEVGDLFILSMDERLVPMRIKDTVRLFPTMEKRESGFLVADFDQLLRHLGVRNPKRAGGPNEFFVSLSPITDADTRNRIHDMARPGIEIRDRESISESFDLNPLVTAGWRAVTLVALAVVAFTALTGIVTYLLFFSDSNRGEIGVVRSLGLAHRQMIGLLALEHLLIAVVGMGLGTWSGLRMSSMMAPLVSLAESGGEVLPPIVVVIDWLTLSVFYIGVAATFATMLFIINRSVFRWDSDTASRLES